MRKKHHILIAGSTGEIYYVDQYEHPGLYKEYKGKVFCFRRVKKGNPSLLPPFIFEKDGSLPEVIKESLIPDNLKCKTFNTLREYKNFLSKNKIVIDRPNFDQELTERLDLTRMHMPNRYDVYEDSRKVKWIVSITTVKKVTKITHEKHLKVASPQEITVVGKSSMFCVHPLDYNPEDPRSPTRKYHWIPCPPVYNQYIQDLIRYSITDSTYSEGPFVKNKIIIKKAWRFTDPQAYAEKVLK